MMAHNPIEHHTADVGELELHYAEAAGSGPPLLLLHGITGSEETYELLMPRLAQVAHVFALDFRGHGLSDRAPDPAAYLVPDYSGDVQTFLRTVVKEPVLLAGHSLGGLVGSWTAAHAPDLVRGLFLEDPPFYTAVMPFFKETIFFAFFGELRAALKRHVASGGSVDDLAKEIAQWPAAEGVTMLDQLGEEGVQMRARMLHHFDYRALAPEILESIWSVPDPDSVLAQIRCPTHLVAGQYDLGGAMTDEDVPRAVAALPGCTHTVFGDVGHSIHAEKSQEYLSELQRFAATV